MILFCLCCCFSAVTAEVEDEGVNERDEDETTVVELSDDDVIIRFTSCSIT